MTNVEKMDVEIAKARAASDPIPRALRCTKRGIFNAIVTTAAIAEELDIVIQSLTCKERLSEKGVLLTQEKNKLFVSQKLLREALSKIEEAGKTHEKQKGL